MSCFEIFGKGGKRIASGHVGEIKFFPVDTPPAHTLVCNGAELSIAAYPELYAVIGTKYGGNGSTTFLLPNTEDRFPRFAGGGLIVGEKQEDAIRNIEGTAIIDPFSTSAAEVRNATGAFYTLGRTEILKAAGSETTYGDSMLRFNAGAVVPTADENRPKAIALLACIVYE